MLVFTGSDLFQNFPSQMKGYPIHVHVLFKQM